MPPSSHSLQPLHFINIHLRTPLLRLARIMLRLILLLGALIARQSREGRSRSPLGTVHHAGAQISQLALSFLSLSFGILLLPFLFEALGSH